MAAKSIDSQLEALSEYLKAIWGARDVQVREAKRLSGGAIQENWLLSLTVDGGLQAARTSAVLRADATSTIGASRTRADEYVILSAAHAARICVAEPLGLCTQKSVLGRSFFMMQAVEGTAGGSRIVRDHTLTFNRTTLVKALAGELAKIHRLQPGPALSGVLGVAPINPIAELISSYRHGLDAATRPSPVCEFALRWLERQSPAKAERSFCHRDFRTGNFMVNASGLAAILDWEFAGWGCPSEDIGWFCSKAWRFGASELEAGGIATRREFVEAYELASDRKINAEELLFWELMANVRWAVIAQQQSDRFSVHGDRSLELALIGRRIHETELEIVRILGLHKGIAA